MKVWAKVINGDKMVRDTLFENDNALSALNYQRALRDIAYNLDIATPLSLNTHFKQFSRFNRVKYLPRDFIEDVDFTSIVLELVVDKD